MSGIEEIGMMQTGGMPLGTAIILKREDGPSVVAFLMDAEMDVFEVRFDPDPTSPFEIRADGVTHISTDADQLNQIAELKYDADRLWSQLGEFWSEEVSEWVGWEHLSMGTHPTERTKNERRSSESH